MRILLYSGEKNRNKQNMQWEVKMMASIELVRWVIQLMEPEWKPRTGDFKFKRGVGNELTCI